MAAQLYCNGPKDKYTSVVSKEAPVQENGKHYISLTPPSNSWWINYIEFGRKETMLSSEYGP
jgi:hypothetical protein